MLNFITSTKVLIFVSTVILGGGITLVGSYIYENHQLKNQVAQLNEDLLEKYVEIGMLNQKLAKQAEEINKANLGFDQYRKKVQKKYSFADTSNPNCDFNTLNSLLTTWSTP